MSERVRARPPPGGRREVQSPLRLGSVGFSPAVLPLLRPLPARPTSAQRMRFKGRISMLGDEHQCLFQPSQLVLPARWGRAEGARAVGGETGNPERPLARPARPASSAVTGPGRELPPPAAPRPPPPPLPAPPVPASSSAPVGPTQRCPGRRRACERREESRTSPRAPRARREPRVRGVSAVGAPLLLGQAAPDATVPAPAAAAVASARIRARLGHRAIILGRAVTSPGHRLRRRLPEVSLRTAGHARRAHAHTRTARPVPPAHTHRVLPRALLRSPGRRPRAPSTVPGALRPHVCARKRLPRPPRSSASGPTLTAGGQASRAHTPAAPADTPPPSGAPRRLGPSTVPGNTLPRPAARPPATRNSPTVPPGGRPASAGKEGIRGQSAGVWQLCGPPECSRGGGR